jgi:glucose-6-phosphate isomerase
MNLESRAEAHQLWPDKQRGFFAANQTGSRGSKARDLLFTIPTRNSTKRRSRRSSISPRALGVGSGAALFAGEPLNTTEHRPALHMALRNLSGEPMFAEGHDVVPEVLAERAKMQTFAESVHNGEIRSASGARFTAIVNIGIGGSDLGPAMASRAPRFVPKSSRLHTVANVAARSQRHLGNVPARNHAVICSKLITIETMTTPPPRARPSRNAWPGRGRRSFCAVSALDKSPFGIDDRVFGFLLGRRHIRSGRQLGFCLRRNRKQNFEEFLLGDKTRPICRGAAQSQYSSCMACLNLVSHFWGTRRMPSFLTTSEWRGFPLICNNSKWNPMASRWIYRASA